MSIETLQREETITKPPTRWKNRWRYYGPDESVGCQSCGRSFFTRRGQIVETHCIVYSSRDVAETDAEKAVGFLEYLGAFPVEAP